MTLSNSAGAFTKLVDIDSSFSAFERLPAAVRQALRDSAYNWMPQQIMAFRKQGRLSVVETVAYIRWMDLARARDNGRVHLYTREAITESSVLSEFDGARIVADFQAGGKHLSEHFTAPVMNALREAKISAIK